MQVCRALALSLVLSACITPKEKKDMQNDMFTMQTRLLSLERSLTDTSKEAKNTGESAAKRVASAQADVERTNRDIQQMKGEIDALKVGVTTGRMPGSNEEGTVGDQLQQLTERVEAIEQSQEELMQALKKAGLNTGKSKAKDKDKDDKKTIASAKDLQQAYDAKHFKQVLEEAPKILKKADGKDKQVVIFLQAESLFKLGKMREAALKYNDYLETKPNEKQIPLTKMRIGDCFRHLGDAETAKVYYEELIKEFPDSAEATKAKERLAGGSAEKG